MKQPDDVGIASKSLRSAAVDELWHSDMHEREVHDGRDVENNVVEDQDGRL